METIETNNLIFEDYTNAPYFKEIVFYVDEHEQEILNFFKMTELPSKWKVKFIPFEEFKEYMIKRRGKYEDYMAGQTTYSEKTVYALNIEDQVKYTKHKDTDMIRINKNPVEKFLPLRGIRMVLEI